MVDVVVSEKVVLVMLPVSTLLFWLSTLFSSSSTCSTLPSGSLNVFTVLSAQFSSPLLLVFSSGIWFNKTIGTPPSLLPSSCSSFKLYSSSGTSKSFKVNLLTKWLSWYGLPQGTDLSLFCEISAFFLLLYYVLVFLSCFTHVSALM